MNDQELQQALRQTTRFKQFQHVEHCDSSQALAQASVQESNSATPLATPLESGLFWADHQSQGRGRQGRVWQDAADQDLAFTCLTILRQLPSPVSLAGAVPVALVQALEACMGMQLQIKWPNDLLCNGRKLCGILIDSHSHKPSAQNSQAVQLIGIGINVNRSQFPEELQDLATSMALATGCEFDRHELLLRLCQSLEQSFQQLESGQTQDLESLFAQRMGLLHKQVTITTGKEELRGQLSHLDFHHATLADGRQVSLAHVLRLQA